MKPAHSGLRPLSPCPFSLSLSPGWELTSPGKDNRAGHQPHRGTGRGEGSREKGNAQRSRSAFPCSAHSPLVPVPGGSVSVPGTSPAPDSPPALPQPGPAPAGSSLPPPWCGQQAAEPPVPAPGPRSPHGQPQPSPQSGPGAERTTATPTWPAAAPAPGLTASSMPREPTWPPSSTCPRPTAPSMPREPTWPPSSPCPRAGPRTTAPSMPQGAPPCPDFHSLEAFSFFRNSSAFN